MHTPRLLVISLLALGLYSPWTSPAWGGELADAALGCDDRVYGTPFMPWLDPLTYVHMPDGGLENGAAGWTLTGGAAVVAGNEPFYVSSAADSRSLHLPSGSSATTAATCAAATDLVARFFVRRKSGSLLSRLRVDAVYENAAGEAMTAPGIGLVIALGSGWQPTLPIVVPTNALAHVVDAEAVVALRFTPSRGSSWQIDDVYLDPFAKH